MLISWCGPVVTLDIPELTMVEKTRSVHVIALVIYDIIVVVKVSDIT